MAEILSDRNIAHTDPHELLQELEKLESWLTENCTLFCQEKISTRVFTLLVRLISVQNYKAEHQLLAVVRSLAKLLSENYVDLLKNVVSLNACETIESAQCLQVLAIIFHDILDQRDLFNF